MPPLKRISHGISQRMKPKLCKTLQGPLNVSIVAGQYCWGSNNGGAKQPSERPYSEKYDALGSSIIFLQALQISL